MSIREHKTPKAPLSFPREARITRGAELQRITREGKRIRTIHIEVRVAASPFSHPDRPGKGMRVGLVVPRFKHSAVERNQVKRRLRELSRLQLLPTGMPVDIVLRIRPEAYSASFSILAIEIGHVLTQLQRWYAASEGVKADMECIIKRTSEML